MLAATSIGPFVKFGVVPHGSDPITLGVNVALVQNVKVWAHIVSFFGLPESFRLGLVNKTLQLALKHVLKSGGGVFRAWRLAKSRR
jgi:hypothetical protein